MGRERHPGGEWAIRVAWLALCAVHIMPLGRCLADVGAAFGGGGTVDAGPPIATAAVLLALIAFGLRQAAMPAGRPRTRDRAGHRAGHPSGHGVGDRGEPRSARRRRILAGLLAVTIAHHDVVTDPSVESSRLLLDLTVPVAVAGILAGATRGRRDRWRRTMVRFWRRLVRSGSASATCLRLRLVGRVDERVAVRSAAVMVPIRRPRGPPVSAA